MLVNFVYSFLIICFIIAVFNKKNAISIYDYKILLLALFFTLVGDFFITLNDYYFNGILSFCIVQTLYIKRYWAKIKIYQIIPIQMILFLFFTYNSDKLTGITIIYILTFIFSLISIRKLDEKTIPKTNMFLIIFGMVAFALCDVCVGLHSIFPYRYLYYLIWVFYLPSQLMLALSGRKFD